MQLSQKETSLLKDLKGQEKLCVEKYNNHAKAAKDPQLQALFSHIESIEQQHLETIVSIENGSFTQQGNSSSSSGTNKSFSEFYGMAENDDKKNDAYLCTDVLSTEKHASHLYDTCIFEFKQENLRNALNHIQKEEQDHGKMIYDYMSTNGMYS